VAVSMLDGAVDDNTILSNQREIDMDEDIAMLEPDEAPLVTFLMKMRKRPAYSQKVEWLEDELHPRYTVLTASYTSGLTIAVATGTGAYFKPFDVIKNELTGENMLVTGVAADVLTVERGKGSVASTSSIGSTDGIVRLSNASAEGAKLGTLKQTKKVAQYNYCQIIRTPFGMTETLLASKLYGQKNVMAFEANKKETEHKIELEQTLWEGRRLLETSGAHPRAYMGGVLDYISTNTATGGAMTQKTWEQFLIGSGSAAPKVARYGSSSKVAFCAPIVLGALSSYPASKLAINDTDVKDWGVSLEGYRSANGFKLALVEKREWADRTKTSPGMGGSAVILSMGNVVMRPLRDTMLKPNREDNDEDSKKQEFLTETSFMLKQERTHAWLRGVTDWA
jgi:Family of unknown function (DUF5309)